MKQEADQGWIRLHRKITSNALWMEPREFSRAEAWIDLIMEARYSETPANILIGLQVIECQRGQTIKSLDTWAKRWRWSKSRVSRYLDMLERLEQIRVENVVKTVRITVCNYDTYNPLCNDGETIAERVRNACETQAVPNNKDKKDKKENREIAHHAEPDATINQDSVKTPKAPAPRPKTYKQWTAQEFLDEVNRIHETQKIIPTDDDGGEFYDYWIEPSPSGKMRFQLERTWDTARRMWTWRKNMDERVGKKWR